MQYSYYQLLESNRNISQGRGLTLLAVRALNIEYTFKIISKTILDNEQESDGRKFYVIEDHHILCTSQRE